MTQQENNLKPQQRKAIISIINTRSISEAARESNIPERTLHRWMKTPSFRNELLIKEEEIFNSSMRRLINLQNSAIDVFIDLLNSENESMKFRAAKEILVNTKPY